MSAPWTRAQIDAVEDALREQLPMAAIVAHVEETTGRACSDNAIISIVNRTLRLRAIGFAKHKAPDPDEPMAMIPPKLAPELADLEMISAPPSVSASRPVPLLNLSSRQCRFPIAGDGRETLFCGAAVHRPQPGRVHGCYCDHHRGTSRQ